MKRLSIIFLCGIVTVFGIIKMIHVFHTLAKDTPLEQFQPFSSTHPKIELESSFKISQNSPTIGAASAFYPFAGNFVQMIYDKSSYQEKSLQLLSTSEAYEKLVNNTVDMIIATMPSDEQKAMIENANISVEFIPLYEEPLCIYLNQKNKVSNLTQSQLKSIYEKELSWKEFHGQDIPIHTYQLEKNNGSQTCFETIVKNNLISSLHHEVNDMAKIIDEVGKNQAGIGYAFYSYFKKMHINSNVKDIMIDGKKVTEENYPLQFMVYLIYRKDNTNENIGRMVSFFESQEGKRLIKLAK